MRYNYAHMRLFFDIETNGLPIKKGYDQYYHPCQLDFYKNSRIVEFGYIIDNNSQEIVKKSFITNPKDFKITNSSIHGITEDIANKEGNDLNEILDIFLSDLKKYQVTEIISHNLQFDLNILLSECYRNKKLDIIDFLKSCEKSCTMKISKLLLKLDKYPKLIELYKSLLNKDFKQEHRVLSDIEACKQCYYRLMIKL